MKNIQECGEIIYKTDMGFIFGMIQKMKINFLEIDMQANGKMAKEMDMEYSIIVMVIYMKANGKKIKKKGLEYFIIKIEQNMQEVLNAII